MAEPMDTMPPPPQSRLTHYGHFVSARLQDNLRDCQRDALNALIHWFQSDVTKKDTAVVVMPTGSGKTGVICSLPYWFGKAIQNQQLDIELNQPILVIAPGLNILNQMESEFIPIPGQKPCFLMKVGAIKDKQDELRYVLYSVKVTKSTTEVDYRLRGCKEDIVLTNVQKWRSQTEAVQTWSNLEDNLFSIIIVDEAHHLPAPQWQNIIDKFQSHAKVIFFTATPYRTDGKSITSSIHTHGYAYLLKDDDAVKKRIIRPIEFKDNLIKFEAGEPPHEYRKHSKYTIQCAEAVTAKVIKYIKSKDETSPLPGAIPHCAMIITADTMEAEIMFSYCQKIEPDVETECVHSAISGQEDKEIMMRIGDKKVRVFVIVKKLLEGFDYPRVSVAGIATRICSPLMFAQFVGRARRVIRGETNISADVITHEYFEQEKPYETFISGRLIRSTVKSDEAEEAEEAEMNDTP